MGLITMVYSCIEVNTLKPHSNNYTRQTVAAVSAAKQQPQHESSSIYHHTPANISTHPHL